MRHPQTITLRFEPDGIRVGVTTPEGLSYTGEALWERVTVDADGTVTTEKRSLPAWA